MIRSQVALERGGHVALTTWPGSPPPLVALHGLGQLAVAWDTFALAIDGRAAVIAPDLCGHGDSAPDPSGEYALGAFVDDVARCPAIDERPVLMGHSLGGRIALEIAARNLAPLRGVILVDSSPAPPEATLRHLDGVFADAPAAAASRAAYAQRLAERHPFAAPEHLEPLVEGAAVRGDGAVVEKVDPAALAAWSAGRLRSPFPPRNPAGPPIVLVRGIASSVLPRRVARELLESGDVDQLVEIERSGHDVHLDNPSALARLAMAFVADAEGPR